MYKRQDWGSFSTRITADSSSFSTRITDIVGGDITLTHVTSSGDVLFQSDLTVDGKVTAQEFHTEVVSSSIIFTSGSTIFGDTSDDTHRFTGSLKVTETGSFGQLEIGNGGDIILTEDQRIYFEADKTTYIESHASDSFRAVVNNRQMLLLDEDTGNRAVFGLSLIHI